MVDIHSHILYGLDDGPKSVDISRAMLDLAVASGTSVLVATPHSDLRYSYNRSTVEAKLDELRTLTGGRIELHAGCEMHLSYENLRGAVEDPARFAIGRGPYLLVELPEDRLPPNTRKLLGSLIHAGLAPIIAHPERNPLLRHNFNELRQWVTDGCLIQVTAQSLSGRFGRSAQAAATALVRDGLVHFLASDAHDARHRPPGLAQAFDLVSERWGEELAVSLCITNPAAAVAGESVPERMPRPKPARRWFSFLSA